VANGIYLWNDCLDWKSDLAGAPSEENAANSFQAVERIAGGGVWICVSGRGHRRVLRWACCWGYAAMNIYTAGG